MSQTVITSIPRTIPCSEAKTRTENWRAHNPDLPKSFAFGFQEMFDLMVLLSGRNMLYELEGNTEKVIKAVRFYLGEEEPELPGGKKTYSLMMVGVDGSYESCVDNKNTLQGGRDLLSEDLFCDQNQRVSLIFDFSCPCPNSCPTDSPLNSNVNCPDTPTVTIPLVRKK